MTILLYEKFAALFHGFVKTAMVKGITSYQLVSEFVFIFVTYGNTAKLGRFSLVKGGKQWKLTKSC
jgi:hypothetical protein